MSDDEFKPVVDVSEYSNNTLGELIEAEKGTSVPEKIHDLPLDDLEKDFEIARETMVNILIASEDVMEGMQKIAEESDSPRAYEVLANMMTSFVASSKELVELHHKKESIKEKKHKREGSGEGGQHLPDGNYTQNNIVFQGSPTDLLDALEQKRNGNSE